MTKDAVQSIDDLTYEWPSNLSQYEARIFLGLTAAEAMAGALAFLLPVGTIQSKFGFFIGLVCGIIVLLSIKKFERFGNRSILVFLFLRTAERRHRLCRPPENPEIELPLIMGGSSGRLEVENWEGETIMTIEE